MSRCAGHAAGFTTIELTVVVMLTGILAAMAIPRLLDRGAFDERGYQAQFSGTLRLAQKIAIAARREVCVNIVAAGAVVAPGAPSCPAGPGVVLTLNAADPSGLGFVAGAGVCGAQEATNPFIACAPNGVVATTIPPGIGAFRFDALGRPIADGAAAVPTGFTLTGVSVRTVTMAPDTGYITCLPAGIHC